MPLLYSGRFRAIPTILCLLCLYVFPSAGRTAPPTDGSEIQKLTDLTILDAVRTALAQQPDVFIAREAATFQKGVYTEAGGEFDLTGEASLSLNRDRASIGARSAAGFTAVPSEQDTAAAGLGLHKKLRTGQTLSLEVAESRTDATMAGIQQTGPDNVGQVFFTVIQPLGKGRGREGADAGEETARRQAEAALQEMLHVLSRKAAEAAQAYWNHLSAIRQVKILEEAEERSRVLTEQISTLIAKEELPAVEITQAQANLADARRVRLNGDQALFDSRQQLLLAMGIEGRQLAASVACRDDFPAIPDEKAMRSFDPQALAPIALKLRSDYRAREWAESAREVFLSGVERNMAPQVDLKLKAGYVGYEPGSGLDALSRSFEENVPGASVSMQIVASWPFSNSAMKGRMVQARSQLEQVRWEKEKLDRQIRSDLMSAWSQLKSRIAVLEEAAVARDKYEASLASEKKKYLLGMSTLINVLTVENQVTQARLNGVLAQTEVAASIVKLRFESGTLLSEDGEWITVRAEDLIRLPPTEMLPQNPPRERIPPGKGGQAW